MNQLLEEMKKTRKQRTQECENFIAEELARLDPDWKIHLYNEMIRIQQVKLEDLVETCLTHRNPYFYALAIILIEVARYKTKEIKDILYGVYNLPILGMVEDLSFNEQQIYWLILRLRGYVK